MQGITGYKRKDGRFGIRNYLLVLPVVVCANTVVDALSREYGDRIIAVTHPYGCTFDNVSNTEFEDTMAGFASNPNVGAVLLVGLGCETVDIKRIFAAIKERNDLVEYVSIQEAGGTRKTIEAAKPIVDGFLDKLAALEREPMQVSDLLIGTECGASDSYSGLSANPVLGLLVDRVIDEGGSAFLTEMTECIGAEHALLDRCVNQADRDKLQAYLDETERHLARVGSNELRDIAPGNIAGGLTTLEEKSLGCIKKGGSRPIVEVVGHGEIPSKKGLVVMDGPGQDVESLVSLATGGAQLSFFTTGRGTPAGNPIMPVVKVSSNTAIAQRYPDDIDINTGTVIDGSETLKQAADRMYDFMLEIINGEETKCEKNHCREFAIRRRGKDVCIL